MQFLMMAWPMASGYPALTLSPGRAHHWTRRRL